MRILHVISNLRRESGGPVSALLGLASAQVAQQIDVSIVTTGSHPVRDDLPAGVRVTQFRPDWNRWCYSRQMGASLRRIIAEHEIVHIHMVWEYPTWIASRICEDLARPYILRPCGMLEDWSLTQSSALKRLYLSAVGRRIIKSAAALHFTSDRELELSKFGNLASSAFVLQNGLVPDYFAPISPAVFYQRFPWLQGARIVLFVGRLHRKKQPELLIEAFEIFSRTFPKFALVFVGPCDRPFLNRLVGRVAALDLIGRVHFVGMLEGDALVGAYRAAEVFVLPSLQENFGNSVAEAMAAGVPVVVTAQVSLAREVREAKGGVICASDARSIASALASIANDEPMRRVMGKSGRAFAMRCLRWSDVAGELSAVYSDVCAGARKSRAWRAYGS